MSLLLLSRFDIYVHRIWQWQYTTMMMEKRKGCCWVSGSIHQSLSSLGDLRAQSTSSRMRWTRLQTFLSKRDPSTAASLSSSTSCSTMEVGRSCLSRSSNQLQARLCKMHQSTSDFVWCRFEKKRSDTPNTHMMDMTRINNFVSNTFNE